MAFRDSKEFWLEVQTLYIMNERDFAYFNGIELNEGAYIYKSIEDITKKDIDECFKTIKENSEDFSALASIKKKTINYSDDKSAVISLLLFSHKNTPLFLQGLDKPYQKKEVYIGYLVIIEIEAYVAIFSRHASKLGDLKNKLQGIDGATITGAILSDDSKFTQMRMGTMSLNPLAIRNKSYEGQDLSQSLPTFGANQNIVKTTRIITDGQTTTVCLGTSRISKFGDKKVISELCLWVNDIIDGIKAPFDINTTLLRNFAKPIKWIDKKDFLIPKYLLIDVHELRNIINQQNISLFLKTPGKKDEYSPRKNSTLDTLLKRYDTCLDIEISLDDDDTWVCKNTWKCLRVKISKTGIKLVPAGLLDNLYLKQEGAPNKKITTFINEYKCYTVGFSDIKYIYHGGQLHEDLNVKSSIDSLLSVFEEITEMVAVKSEKGSPEITSTSFPENTVFNVIENYYRKKGADFIVCDDLGNENADYIIINNNTLSFVHAKAKAEDHDIDKPKSRTSLSASQFQAVVGQALKNIGNIRNMNVCKKVESWRGKVYSGTSIQICRLGNIDDFESAYNQITGSPNGIKEVCLAVDFVSLKEIKAAFNKIKADESFQQKNSVNQMIWLLNAFVSSCKDADLHCKIFCRP